MADGAEGIASFEQSDSPSISVYKTHRTEEGLAYDSFRSKLLKRLREDNDFCKARNAELANVFRQKTVEPSQVHTNAFMTALSVKYRNDDYIGEQLLPVVSVPKYSDNFATYDRRDITGAPDDSMEHRSDPNEVNVARGSGSYALEPRALKNDLPQSTIENQDPAFDEMMDLVANINEMLAFNREKRCATLLTTTANYSGNTVTLAGADQWSSGGGGNPLKNIQDALAATWQGAGPGEYVGFCSNDVANVLARHPQLLDLFKYTAPGLTRMDILAQQLGLSRILVSGARKDTANIGQTAAYSRIWGKGFGVIRVAKSPSLRNASFGYTLRFKGHPLTFQWFDMSRGVCGTHYAKVSMMEQQKVIAAPTGYFIDAAIA